MNNAIEVKRLTKNYGKDKNIVAAVDGIDLCIEKGQVFGILGPNGAGKTTTIRMLCGLLRPTRGEITILGKPLLRGKSKLNHLAIEHIGICPQELVVWDGMTLMEQLIFMGAMYNISKVIAKERALSLLEAMHLLDKKDKLASTLSGGMKRRLNILLALMHDPQILILDEPQAGLDPQSRVLVREYIERIAQSKTILITTHDMEEADKLCRRVAIIDYGKILVEASPNALKSSLSKGEIVEFELENIDTLNLQKVEIWKNQYGKINILGNKLQCFCEKPIEVSSRIRTEVMDSNVSIKDMKIRQVSLEDVFINLTGRGMRE